ncbi:hypothetical protein HY478_03125 [Candidatus Uhrbacteria bacterium]|nr:hypothetical protein [Candidatus Uhrbacteria bacterium]
MFKIAKGILFEQRDAKKARLQELTMTEKKFGQAVEKLRLQIDSNAKALEKTPVVADGRAELIAAGESLQTELEAAVKSRAAALAVLEEARIELGPQIAELESQIERTEGHCRLHGCENTRRESRRSGSDRKRRRGTQIFCGRHAGIRGKITTASWNELAGNGELRVFVA